MTNWKISKDSDTDETCDGVYSESREIESSHDAECSPHPPSLLDTGDEVDGEAIDNCEPLSEDEVDQQEMIVCPQLHNYESSSAGGWKRAAD